MSSFPISPLGGEPEAESPTSRSETDEEKRQKLKSWRVWEPLPELPNPGKYESKEILGTAELFDGFRFDINKGASETFGVTHSFSLGSVQEPANYSLATTYMDKGTMILGKIDTSSQLIGRFQQTLSDKWVFRAIGQASNEAHNSAFHCELDYFGSNYFTQFKWTNPGFYGIAYLQSITQKFSMGCDAFYNYKQGYSMVSLSGRWADDKNIITGFGALGTINLSYTRKVSNKASLSTNYSLQGTQNGLESLWTVGYRYQLTHSMIKGTINSAGRVTALLEQTLSPFAKLLISGDLDHKKKEYRFGFGMEVNI